MTDTSTCTTTTTTSTVLFLGQDQKAATPIISTSITNSVDDTLLSKTPITTTFITKESNKRCRSSIESDPDDIYYSGSPSEESNTSPSEDSDSTNELLPITQISNNINVLNIVDSTKEFEIKPLEHMTRKERRERRAEMFTQKVSNIIYDPTISVGKNIDRMLTVIQEFVGKIFQASEQRINSNIRNSPKPTTPTTPPDSPSKNTLLHKL